MTHNQELQLLQFEAFGLLLLLLLSTEYSVLDLLHLSITFLIFKSLICEAEAELKTFHFFILNFIEKLLRLETAVMTVTNSIPPSFLSRLPIVVYNSYQRNSTMKLNFEFEDD